ncbi:BTB/POZ and MATH domain-containing protein 3-like [Lolium perenne]|uniref:BTB/POZ and MATH domain-containing protein 3-like n=1 Tax=Lolium perenne TaxID=4522 RepID=UPI0021F5BEA0|nr:BTB/POZ and MATH domain-containing protein 3-like [Lolium perenne]
MSSSSLPAKDLEESVYFKDDVFRVRCDITVTKEIVAELTTPRAVVVPPSDMHQHLAWLLSSSEGSDVAFEVGGETFPAHRCILSASSEPSSSVENAAARVRIDDMEPKAFRAMLHFVYTDSLAEGSTAAMAQHLLVAADR